MIGNNNIISKSFSDVINSAIDYYSHYNQNADNKFNIPEKEIHIENTKNIDNFCLNQYNNSSNPFLSQRINVKPISNKEETTQTEDKLIEQDEDSFINKKRNFLMISLNETEDIQKYFGLKEKSIKKLGRKKRNSGKMGKHNKYSKDNITKKIKAYFLNNIRIWINSGLSTNEELVKTKGETAININKGENIKLFDKILRDIFSENISKKYRRFSKEYNKNQIESFYKNKEKYKLQISKLELSFMEVYNIFKNEKINKETKEKVFKIIPKKNYEKNNFIEKDFLKDFKFKKNLIESAISKGGEKKYINKLEEFIDSYEKLFYEKEKVKNK